MALDGDKIYVADADNYRIDVWTKSGTPLPHLCAGLLGTPYDVALYHDGGDTYMYVAEMYGHRISKWLIGASGASRIAVRDGFNQPHAVATDANLHLLYVAEADSHRIRRLNMDLADAAAPIGTGGSGVGQFNRPTGVAVDSVGNIYICDKENSRVQKCDSNGNFVPNWGAGTSFLRPIHLVVSPPPGECVFITDSYNHRVQKLNLDGSYVTQFGSLGSGNGQFINPTGIDVDMQGNVYVGDYGNNRLHKWAPQRVNRPPVANPDSLVSDEDTVLRIVPSDLLGNDTDADGDRLALASYTQPQHGVLVTNQDGSLSYTSPLNFNGEDVFTYQAKDIPDGALSDTAMVTLTVRPVNDPPAAGDDTAVTDEDKAVTVAVLTNDTDVENDHLTISTAGTPEHGTAAADGDGILYTPAANWSGEDRFTYTVDDGNGGTDTGEVKVTVRPVNDPPVAGDDPAVTDEDRAVTVAVLTNDTDVDGDLLSTSTVGTPQHGTATVDGDGILYTPAADWFGEDHFSYTIDDGNGGTDTGDVTVTVRPVNDPPVAVDDTKGTDEDTPVTVAVLANDTDIENDPLTISAVGTPEHGTATADGDGILYAPAANWFGEDHFSYTVDDGDGGTDIGAVKVTVRAVNDPPVAVTDPQTVDEDTELTVAAPGLLSNDTDVDGDALTAVLVSNVTHGTLVLSADGSLTYTPDANWNGTDSFLYKANDGQADSNEVTVEITVKPVNDAPEITSITGPVDPCRVGSPVDMSAHFTDVDAGDTHTAVWTWEEGVTSDGTVTEPTDGVPGSVSGSHTYTTPGVYTVALKVTDQGGLSDEKPYRYYVVIYDPDGGFVTGGGWIISPTGAYAANASLTGKASFGFNSKYQRGASIPTGQTQFQFKVADLNFHSTSHEWLVVAGARAQYKGSGKINGAGDYRFLLTAVDGQVSGGGGVDKFRIKIWETDGDVVYDNKLGEADDSDTATELGGGSIVIHKDSSRSVVTSAMVTGASAAQTAAGAQIVFTLNAEATVSVEVVNIAGRAVRQVAADRPGTAGVNTVLWDGRSATGTRVPRGMYLVRVTARAASGSASSAMVGLQIL